MAVPAPTTEVKDPDMEPGESASDIVGKSMPYDYVPRVPP